MFYAFFSILTALFILISAFILKNWRLGVVLMFILLIFEDSIRKIIPGQPSYVMLFKDALIFLTYFSFFLFFAINHKKIWKPPFIVPLLFFSAFLIINVFNPITPNLFFGLVGLRHYLWYAPLMFLGYYMFSDKDKFLLFAKKFSYIAIPLFAFVIMQYAYFGSDAPILNPLAGNSKIHNFTDVESEQIPLLTSFFGTAHRYSRFSMFLFFLGFGLLIGKLRSREIFSNKEKFILIFSIVSSFGGIILSGVRTAFVLTIFGTLAFLAIFIVQKNGIINFLIKNKKILIYSSLIIALLALLIFFFARDFGIFHITAFYYAFQERIPWAFAEVSRAFSEVNLFGNGTGTISQGIDRIPNGAGWIEFQSKELRGGFWFETGVGKILFEGGIIGFIIFYLFWGAVFIAMFKELRKLKDFFLKNIGVAVFIFSFLMLMWFSFIHNQVLNDATTLVVLWFFIGVLFKLNKLSETKI